MARGFEFRLARVQRVREIFEETARAELGIAISAVNQASDYVDYLRSQIVSARATLAELQIQPNIDPRSLIAKDQSVGSLLAVLPPAKLRLRELRVAEDRAKALWIDKKAEAQALDRLATRHRDRHRDEANTKENAEQDEVSIARAFAKTSEEGPDEKSSKRRVSPFSDALLSADISPSGPSTAAPQQ
ncbi:MAG: hypothetical protein OSB10_03195 [Planctomycetota bacterium]|nr:hypothetical protein [Planctomycetota bacterium]